MKHTGKTTLDVPLDQIDLCGWLFTLSDAEYQAAAPTAHRAAGVYVQNGVRGTVNVESIGGHLIIQHYREVHASPTHVEMFSSSSRVYLFHLVPARAQVRWTMTATEQTAATSEFNCTVELILSRLLRVLGGLSGLSPAIRKHTLIETEGFARDMVRKAKAVGG